MGAFQPRFTAAPPEIRPPQLLVILVPDGCWPLTSNTPAWEIRAKHLAAQLVICVDEQSHGKLMRRADSSQPRVGGGWGGGGPCQERESEWE